MRSAVIPFAGRLSRVGLSLNDRMAVAMWQSKLRPLGYDRVVVHERASCDPPELDSFLSIYRRGESFAHWSLTRKGDSVEAWYSGTGEDVGRFPSMEEALAALFPELPGMARHQPAAPVIQAFC